MIKNLKHICLFRLLITAYDTDMLVDCLRVLTDGFFGTIISNH